MCRVRWAAAAMNISGTGNQLEPARVMLADPRLVIIQPVEMLEQLEVALDRQGRVLIVIVERREKDAAAQIEIVHAVSSGGKLAAARSSGIAVAAASEFPSPLRFLCIMAPTTAEEVTTCQNSAPVTMRGVPWPSNGLTEIPFRVYTDPEQYVLEQERIFKGPTWSYLCLAGRDPECPAITSPRRSARLLSSSTRDGDGRINAFVNRCAHRGNLLCLERQGNVKEISCIYHGWTYDLDRQVDRRCL